MALSDTAIKAAKPQDKPYKIYDSGGLYIHVTPKGSKLWRMKYMRDGKHKLLSFGAYPLISLREAREQRDKVRKSLALGGNPVEERKTEAMKSVPFDVIADQWLAKKKVEWTDRTFDTMDRIRKTYVVPFIGGRPVSDLAVQDFVGILRRIEAAGYHETARKCLHLCRSVMSFAVISGVIPHNPCSDLSGFLTNAPVRHRAAPTTPESLGPIIRALWGYGGSLVVATALRLQVILAVRPGELRQMEWSEVDLDRAEWSIPATKMKMREAHLVPLPRQAVDMLLRLRPLTGHGRYVLPNPRAPKGDRPMSENAVLVALRGMGFGKDDVTGHGFRATFRTIGEEVLGFRPDLLEQQLAHVVRDPLGRAYNRTKFIDQRREMMQRWADYLDSLLS